MSVLAIGANDVSEEALAFRNHLASKDTQIASHQNQIFKQNEELGELKKTLDDVLHKLSTETTRSLKLEKDLSKLKEDLKTEQLNAHNNALAVENARKEIREKELENKELVAHLDTFSHQSNGDSTRIAQLEKEKTALTARVRELDASLRAAHSTPPPAMPEHRRSSSINNVRISTLEMELEDARGQAMAKDLEVRSLTEKWRADSMRLEHEKVTIERELKARVSELESELEDKEDDLEFLRDGAGSGDREAELMKRIDEDEARIQALEMLLSEADDTQSLKTTLKRVQQQVKAEQQKVFEAQSHQFELVREKEEALDDLDECREEIRTLQRTIEEKDTVIGSLKRNVDTLRSSQSSAEGSPSSTRSRFSAPDPDTVDNIERLLKAVERLRGERDELQRRIKFLELEHKFDSDELEKLRSVAPRSTTPPTPSQDEHDQVQAGESLGLTVEALSLVVQHLATQYDDTVDALARRLATIDELDEEMDELRLKHQADIQCLQEAADNHAELDGALRQKESSWLEEIGNLKTANAELKETLRDMDDQLDRLTVTLTDVESERDSLLLELENLNTDLEKAQDEIQDAENRYSSLQVHQLSSMNDNEATRALTEQIEELKGRVIRRTEMVGVLQHDIKRMETNMRLNEERIAELTSELETLEAEKDAMVEDCADAREARDEAMERFDALELETESIREGSVAVETMVQVVFSVVGQSRMAMHRLRTDSQHARAQIERLEVDHHQALADAEELAADLKETRERLNATHSDAQAVKDALTASQAEVQRLMSSSQSLEDTRTQTQTRISQLQDELAAASEAKTNISNQLEDLQQQAQADRTHWTNQRNSLEHQLATMEASIASQEAAHRDALKEVQRQLAEKEKNLANSSVEQEEVLQLKMKHAEEMGALRSELVETTSLLDQAKAHHEAAESNGSEAAEELRKAKIQLSKEAEALEDALVRCHRLEEELASSRDGWKAERAELNAELARADEDHEASREEIRAQIVQLQTEAANQMQEMQDELEALASELQARTDELTGAKEEAAATRASLDAERESRQADSGSHSQVIADLEMRCHSLEALNNELNQDISSTTAELNGVHEQLEVLKEELTSCEQENTELRAAVQRELSTTRYLDGQVKTLQTSLAVESEQHAQTSANLKEVENAARAAEGNFALMAAKHRREIAQLQSDIEGLRAKASLDDVVAELEERNNEMEELLRAKCAEIEANDDKTLDLLKDNKKLTSKVETLTRKLQNIQTKLKAAKAMGEAPAKPATPETALSRPASAARMSPTPSVPSVAYGASTSHTQSNVATTPTLEPAFVLKPSARTSPTESSRRTSPPEPSKSRPSSLVSSSSNPPNRPRTVTHSSATSSLFSEAAPSIASSSSARTVAGRPPSIAGSTAPMRPKTPERRGFSFRPPSPEKIFGRKRALQDDPPPVPTQPFTAEGAMVPEASKPFKAPHGLHSGFTPSRNKSQRPIVTLSPERPGSASHMHDVTNTEDKPVKRGWLGKIRGASAQPMRT